MNVLPLNTRTRRGEEPSKGALAAIEREMPLITAEVDLLDAHIAVLDRTPSELDGRRLRRAHRRVLAARVELANRTGEDPEAVA